MNKLVFDFSIKYGRLTPLKLGEPNYRGKSTIICKCDCGNEIIVNSYNLKIEKTKSCGCLNTGVKRKDFTGEKFNKVLIIDYLRQNSSRSSVWLCQCDCGFIFECNIRNLISNRIKSCGCWKIEYETKIRLKENHPSWNLSISDNERLVARNYDAYRIWSYDIKKMYNFCCAIYHSNCDIVSHHLNNYAKFIDQRVDINNGVCLCKKCHLDFHKKFGFRNNIKEQYLEYVNDKLGASNNKIE